MFGWWKRRLDGAYQEGYEAAKQEDLAIVEQAIESGAVLAFRECATALKEAAQKNSADAIAEVCRQIAKNARFS